MTIFQVFYKTFSFVVLRLFVVIMTMALIIFLTTSFADFFFRLFGIQAYGIVYTVFYLNFAFIGFMVGTFIFGFLSKTFLFLSCISENLDYQCDQSSLWDLEEMIRGG